MMMMIDVLLPLLCTLKFNYLRVHMIMKYNSIDIKKSVTCVCFLEFSTPRPLAKSATFFCKFGPENGKFFERTSLNHISRAVSTSVCLAVLIRLRVEAQVSVFRIESLFFIHVDSVLAGTSYPFAIIALDLTALFTSCRASIFVSMLTLLCLVVIVEITD